jgi:hypothetical protein
MEFSGVFSCQQIGVNTFYKCIEFQVNSFDSFLRNGLLTKNLTDPDADAEAGVTTIARLFLFEKLT